MIDSGAPRAVRASAARVVALAAAGGEWPLRWVGLVPSLLGQLALGAAASLTSRAREKAGGVGAGKGDAGSGAGAGAGGGAGGGADGEAETLQAVVVNAFDRAESCVTCLEYMAEEVSAWGGCSVGRRR